MIKKLFTFGLLFSLLAVGSASFAQEQEYPHYSFWSNWSIGGSLNVVKQGDHGWNFNNGMNLGLSLIAEKELNHVWSFRMMGMFNGILKDDKNKNNNDLCGWYDNYVSAMVGFKFSITNAMMGYDTNRRASIYLIAMGGASYKRDDANRFNGEFNLTAAAGMGYSYKICKKSTIFVEALFDDHSNVRNIFDNQFLMDAWLGVGYLYNFGPTAADRARLADQSRITKENYDALQAQVDELNGKVTKQNNDIAKLKKDLANAQAQAQNAPVAVNNASADSLQNLIDQIKADQITFYALPFSVLFDIDQYTVSDQEMRKVKAVAKVMKDNPNTKYYVRGFCDKTGSKEYNDKLAQRRANKVADLLVKEGVDKDRLIVEGRAWEFFFGDQKYSINRRVSFYRVIE